MSIYHLHIPRTSGGYVRELILNSLKPVNTVIRHNNPLVAEEFKTADFISGHYGLNPCNYVDKVFTVLRDPNEITFSYIKFITLVRDQPKFNEDYLKKYLYEESLRKSVTNVMTNFLSFEVDIEKYNKVLIDHIKRVNNSWFLKLEDPSSETAIKNISDKNITTFMYDSPTLYDDIARFVGAESFDYSIDKVHESPIGNDHLFEKYFDELSEANKEDIKLYKAISQDFAKDDI
jgi:hypothetical protein